MLAIACFLEKWLGITLSFFSMKRVSFERRNIWEPGADSFKTEGKEASLAIEFSSEGEFEQVKYLLEELLKNKNFLLELIYCSPSVEKKVYEFFLKYKEQIRYQRLVLLDRRKYRIENWVTASKIALVRYDFFPHLINLGRSRDEFILLSCSTKSFRRKNILIRFIYSKIYRYFTHIVCVDESDKDYLVDEGIQPLEKLSIADFRVSNILRRLDLVEETLTFKFPWIKSLEEVIKSFKHNLMLGNFWSDEIKEIYPNKLLSKVRDGEMFLAITPHELSEESLSHIRNWLQRKGIKFIELQGNEKTFPPENLKEYQVVLFNIRGVLCELYSLFANSYVGGGFRKSVHSLLEPYLAGNKVFCGPKVERSSEYDLIVGQDPNKVEVICDESWIEHLREGPSSQLTQNSYSHTEKIVKELIL